MTLWVLGPAVTAGLGRRGELLTPTYPSGPSMHSPFIVSTAQPGALPAPRERITRPWRAISRAAVTLERRHTSGGEVHRADHQGDPRPGLGDMSIEVGKQALSPEPVDPLRRLSPASGS
jgi:hypothetical protein